MLAPLVSDCRDLHDNTSIPSVNDILFEYRLLTDGGVGLAPAHPYVNPYAKTQNPLLNVNTIKL